MSDDIVDRLRQTTEQMASQCSVPMGLWNDHSNACLEAADEIERLRARIVGLEAMLCDAQAEVERLRAALNTPEVDDFARGVVLEAQHQRARWGSKHDVGKAPADWFWLVGYLAGKALAAAIGGNNEKALHHTISTAAALANWHAALSGINQDMRPGIDSDFARLAAAPKVTP